MRTDPALILVLSLLLDRAFGEPPDRIHPTVMIGKTIEWLDQRLSSGLLIFLCLTLPLSLTIYLILTALDGLWLLLVSALILKISFSWRALGDYTRPIARAVRTGNIESARQKIPFIAGRDPNELDTEGVVSTAVESIAESSVDGIVAPLLCFYIFSFMGVEAGAAAAFFYRASNTLDSMIGRPHNPKGWFPAKADETLNLIPARLGAFFLLLSGLFMKLSVTRGYKTFKRYRAVTKSPNAGQTLSVMAGLLGVRLEKKGAYAIGEPLNKLEPSHIYKALRVVDLQILIFVGFMVISWI